MDGGLPFRHDNRALSAGSGTADLSAQGGEGERPVAWVDASGFSGLAAVSTPGSKPVETQGETALARVSGPLFELAALPSSSSSNQPVAALETHGLIPTATASPQQGSDAGPSPLENIPDPIAFAPGASNAAEAADATAPSMASPVASGPPAASSALPPAPPPQASDLTPGWSLPWDDQPDLSPMEPPTFQIPRIEDVLPGRPGDEESPPAWGDMALPDFGATIDELVGGLAQQGEAPTWPGLGDVGLPGLPQIPAPPDIDSLLQDMLGPGGGDPPLDLAGMMDELLGSLPASNAGLPSLSPGPGESAAGLSALPDHDGIMDGLAGDLIELPDPPDFDQLLGADDADSAVDDGEAPDLDDLLPTAPGGLLAGLFEDEGDGGEPDELSPGGLAALPSLDALPALGGLLGGPVGDLQDPDGGSFGWG